MPSAETIRVLVEQATLAPSSHNTQPWRFCASHSSIDLYADRDRALPVNDPDDRELTISCGAALLSLRVAAASQGLACRTELLPDGQNGDRLAHLDLDPAPEDTRLAELDQALPLRRTHRGAFIHRPVARQALDAIMHAAQSEGVTLLSVDHSLRQDVGELVAEGDYLQWGNTAWRAELVRWMRPYHSGDGLQVPSLAAPFIRLAVRHADMGKSMARRDLHAVRDAPWLTMLATNADTPADWLRAGQALQRTLLVACRHALYAGHLNQPVQLPGLRLRLRALLGSAAYPQLLLRWGHPAVRSGATARRPVDAVLDLPMD